MNKDEIIKTVWKMIILSNSVILVDELAKKLFEDLKQ